MTPPQCKVRTVARCGLTRSASGTCVNRRLWLLPAPPPVLAAGWLAAPSWSSAVSASLHFERASRHLGGHEGSSGRPAAKFCEMYASHVTRPTSRAKAQVGRHVTCCAWSTRILSAPRFSTARAVMKVLLSVPCANMSTRCVSRMCSNETGTPQGSYSMARNVGFAAPIFEVRAPELKTAITRRLRRWSGS